MFISNDKLKKILIASGMVDEPTWNEVVKNATRLGCPVEDILKECDIVAGHIFYELVAKGVKLPYVNLKTKDIAEPTLALFDAETVGKYKAIPFEWDAKKKVLKVAFQDPTDQAVIKRLERLSRKKIEPHFTGRESFKFAAKHYQKSVAAGIKKLIESSARRASTPTRARRSGGAKDVSSIFDHLVRYIFTTQPSDVHIEPQKAGGTVKLRIDGFLRDEFFLPSEILRDIVDLIKKDSGIRTDRAHQTRDSRFSRQVFSEEISFRVSILPTYYGEKCVLRVLDESRQRTSLRDLGVRDRNIELVKKEIKKPYGLILVTGPTGSGKSSTLYSLLKFLNVEGVSISTIEDPVEYALPHINQTQVDADSGMTFAAGLRAILRQDPNIIMVGEIRDAETAGITIQSALTGHIVISTLHSNTAAGAITRLRNMDVRSYLLAPTVNMVISQRLVKMICPSCRESYAVEKAHLDRIEGDTHVFRSLEKLKKLGLVSFDDYSDLRFYKGKGCTKCKGSGFSGRIGIFEILHADDAIRRLIADEKPESAIQTKAEENGMLTIFEDGLLKVLQGETTVEEIMRVIN